jgi:hypothetical protein
MRNGGQVENQKMAFFFVKIFFDFPMCCLVCISSLVFVEGSALVVVCLFVLDLESAVFGSPGTCTVESKMTSAFWEW